MSSQRVLLEILKPVREDLALGGDLAGSVCLGIEDPIVSPCHTPRVRKKQLTWLAGHNDVRLAPPVRLFLRLVKGEHLAIGRD